MPETQLHWTRIPTRQTHTGNLTRLLVALAYYSFAGGVGRKNVCEAFIRLILLRLSRKFLAESTSLEPLL